MSTQSELATWALAHWNSCDAAPGLGKHVDGGTRETRRVFAGHPGLIHRGTSHSSLQYGLSAPTAYPPRYCSPVLLYLDTSRSIGDVPSLDLCLPILGACLVRRVPNEPCRLREALGSFSQTTTSSRYGQLSRFHPSLPLATSITLTTRLDSQTMTARARSFIRFTTRTVSPS